MWRIDTWQIKIKHSPKKGDPFAKVISNVQFKKPSLPAQWKVNAGNSKREEGL